MSSKILTNILENIVINNQDTIAITSGEKLITYQQLNDQVNYIANFLLSLNIDRESVVTTFLNDKALQIESLLGIFKSGNIYLPFDVKYGHNHWEELLTKIQPEVLLISREYLESLKKYQPLFQQSSIKIITVKAVNSKYSFSEISIETFEKTEINTENISSETPEIAIADNDSNYIFFTSGTTGKPKAVLGSHISLSHFIHWEIKELDIKDKIQVAQITSLSFDASLRDIFVAFITGSTLHIPDQDTRENPESLIQWLSLKKIKLLHTIPTMLRVITSAGEEMEDHTPDLSELQYILLAGEKLYVKDITKWRALFGNKTVFYNLYGATESTLIKTFYKITGTPEADNNGSIPAGHPISNTRILILNENRDLCKINEKGRVYIKTPFLSKGYYRNQEATAQKFIQNPLNDQKDIIYDTGDLGKYDQDRNLIIIGREDGEVKINGVRVDINSMESTISDFDGVDMVKCIVHTKNNNNTAICFYTSKTLTDNDLKKMCTEYLTVYEQPLLIKIEEFPTNANGKVDVERLKREVENYISDKREIIPPSSATEEKLLDIWKEILEWNTISVKDNFFSVGGHSIKAFKLLNKINKEFNIQCNLNEVYSNPNIAEFAAFLDTQTESVFDEIDKIEEKDSYLCSNSQKRMWLVSLKEENSSLYNVPICLKLKGSIDFQLLETTFKILLEKHEGLRTKFRFEKGELYQYIVPVENLTSIVEVIENCHDIDSMINTEMYKGFRLDKEIPVRVKLIKKDQGSEVILLVIIHHIAYDGWSKSIIFQDFVSIYEDLTKHQPYVIDPLRITYKDYVYWQEAKVNEQEHFWKTFFDNTYAPLNFPLDFPRSKATTKNGNLLKTVIERNQLAKLKNEANKINVSLADYFIGALGMLLNAYTHQENVVIATITSGRNHIDLEDIIGSFINYIPININVNDHGNLNMFFSNLKEHLIQCYNHQNYPYDLMTEKFLTIQDNLRNPIFDIIVVFHHDENNESNVKKIDGVEIEEYQISLNEDYQAKVDIKFDINFSNEEAYISIEYNTDLFKKETIETLCENLIYTIDNLCNDFNLQTADLKNQMSNTLHINHTVNPSNNIPAAKDYTKTKIISSFTAEQIRDALAKNFENFNINSAVSFGAYNQIINELSQQSSSFDNTDYLVVLNRYEDYLNNNGNEENIDCIKNILVKKLEDLPENLIKLVGILPSDHNNKLHSVIEKYNEITINEVKNIPNTFIIDLRNMQGIYPGIEIFDHYKNSLAHIPFTDEFFYVICLYISRTISSIENKTPFKVIALDCDNTLWKGVCGEADLEEIKIKGGYKVLQNFILQKYNEGFIIVLTSKNNEEDVFNVFDNHPEMILKREHIVSWRINWKDKSENIRELAKELNLNINSFIFIDDNPWECQQMLLGNPETLTLLLPENEMMFNQYLHRITAFDKSRISEEDRYRSDLYKTEKERKEFSENLSKKEFIKNLNLQVSVRVAHKNEIDRVYQLLNRTNQFVLNKEAKSTEDISQKITQQNCYAVHLSDRFGDYGLTGIIMLHENDENLIVESFNLSCRILGKEIENCIMDVIKQISIEKNKKKIILKYVKTDRNNYFQEFLNAREDVLLYEEDQKTICELKTDSIGKYDDITLYLNEDIPQKLSVDFYFDHTGIAVKVAEHFQTHMEDVLRSPNQIIKDLNYLTASECHQLLEEFNDTKVDYPSNKTIVELFDEQVGRTPENIAVLDSKIKINYKELKEKSDRVARYLVFNLGKNNEPVGVLVDRSAELLVLLLGILKSGKCYIPIDPMLPKERIEYIINHSHASVIITEEAFLQEFNSIETADNKNKSTSNFIDKDTLLQFENTQEVGILPKPSDTVYIIYTSGSTGNPKGVEIGHQALTNFLTSIQNKPKVQPQDILYSVTTYSFDISILEFFTPLILGASVFIASKETLNNAEQLKAELENINPTIIQATPSFYQMLFNSGWNGNQDLKILCGGDSLNESLAEKLLNHSKEVWNMYGPTETTIWSSTKKIEKPSDASNIGKPISNTQIYIVDKHHNLLPQNTVGRIFIAGDGLAKGYYKNETLTEEKFINNPFSTVEKNNLKMYETGDLGKWNEEGEIEFLGRNDFQVKVRGFRIELGEIETKLQGYPNIKQAVADAKEVNGEKVLVAYYTKDNETIIDKTELREYLQSKLPEYMVPGFFVEMETIPLTPNGKIDRKALPSVSGEDLIRREYVAPGNETEKKLVEIWQQILGIEKVGITDNFFELGGHSLMAGKIMNTISKELNKEVSLKQIFQNQTIESLVKVFNDDSKEKTIIPKAEEKEFYALTPDQMNIWLAGQKEESSNAYNMYSVFEVEGNFDNHLLEKSINRIIHENEILRTNFVEKEGGIFQFIKKEFGFEIDSIETTEADFISIIENYVSQSFNLETDLLLKTAIINCNEKKYLVFLTHHIIVDGMSLEIILNRLITVYADDESEKSINSIQFKDYSEWLFTQNNRSHENIHKFQWDINVKTKVLGNIQENGTIKNINFQLAQGEYAQLKQISGLNKVTTFSIVLTLLSTVLNKIYQQSSISLGIVFSGRNNVQLEDAIGMFIKTLPINLSINENTNFGYLAKLNQDSLIALEEKMNLPFTGNISELTDFLVVYQHSDTLLKEEIDFCRFKLKKQKMYSTQSRFPMVFNFFESEGLKCEVEYNENIDYKITELIWDKMLVLINWVFKNPNQAIIETELLTAQEQQLKSSVDIDFDF